MARKGVHSVVLERSSTLRAEGGGIVIYSNGWRVLDQLGVGAGLRRKSIVMPVYAAKFSEPFSLSRCGNELLYSHLLSTQDARYIPRHRGAT